MSSNQNPFFTPEVADYVLPASITVAVDLVFGNKFQINCPDSHIIQHLVHSFTRQSLHIIHSLTQPPQRINVGGVDMLCFPEPVASPAMLSTNQLNTTIAFLIYVVQNITVDIKTLVGGTGGVTTNIPSHSLSPHLHGVGSTISIAQASVDRLVGAPTDNVMLKQYMMFDIARTFIHELAHAYAFAVLPEDQMGFCFLGNGFTSEIGFEFENRLFGGIFAREDGDTFSPEDFNSLDFSTVLREWPNPHICEAYRLSTFDDIYVRGHVSAVTRKWRVPWDYFASKFHDPFWVRLPTLGNNPLWPVRQIGLMAIAVANNQFDPLDVNLPQASQHIPNGFVFLSNGLLRQMTAEEVQAQQAVQP